MDNHNTRRNLFYITKQVTNLKLIVKLQEIYPAPPNKKRSICISDFKQTTFFYLERYLKKLADDQFSSMPKSSIYHTKHIYIQPFYPSSGLIRNLTFNLKYLLCYIFADTAFLLGGADLPLLPASDHNVVVADVDDGRRYFIYRNTRISYNRPTIWICFMMYRSSILYYYGKFVAGMINGSNIPL